MLLLWLAAFVGGLAAATFGSRRAVTAALIASERSRISPGLIGLTVLAIGTDLPEIANSIVSALSGHGDVIIGDAAGSAFTQVTLVLAILCLAAAPITADRQTVLLVGSMTTGALLVVSLMVRDQVLGRIEGAALVVAWVAAIAVVGHEREPELVARRRVDPAGRALPHAIAAIAWLAVVGAAATVVVKSFVNVTESIGLPELVTSAIVLSLGTSLPELVVDLTAVRRGAVALAIGDLFGSSLLDATLALGIGPSIRAVTVSETATAACIVAAMGVLGATAVGASQPVHGRRSGTVLLLVYFGTVAAMLIATG